VIEYTLLIISAILVGIGIYMTISKKNFIKILIGVEILATGVNLNFITLSVLKHTLLIDPLPHAIVITSIVLDGVLVGVALALALVIYRRFKTLNVDKIRKLRW